jgi:hypothetical protein
MSDKSSILKAFNNHFFEFLDDIIGIFPENNDIREARVTFETFKRGNPTLIIKVWFQYVYTPYASAILSGDISFFIAIVKAHFALFNFIINGKVKRTKHLKSLNSLNGVYAGSVVYQYFIKKKQYFNKIVH